MLNAKPGEDCESRILSKVKMVVQAFVEKTKVIDESV